MKYLVRAVKYLIWFCLILAIMIAILKVSGSAGDSVGEMFRGGYRSLLQIAALFVVFAALYPLTGFRKQYAVIPGEFKDIREGIVDYMASKGYVVESENGEDMTFRLRSKGAAAAKMWEDRLTFTRQQGGYDIEGLRRDVVRIVGGLEYRFRNDTDNYSKS